MRHTRTICYWVHPGRFLAGEYPGSSTPSVARGRIYGLLDAGVTAFLDLTEPRELEPYEEILIDAAEEIGVSVTYQRYPIKELSVPRDRKDMVAILDRLDYWLDVGHTVYTHCWRGFDRTGTVVGCYLVRHGLSGDDALERLRDLWATTRAETHGQRPVRPDTGRQADWIRSWGATGEL